MGLVDSAVAGGAPAFIPPSWRRDLTREIDLIEEVARIHGYEAIPEDVGVPMVPSARRREDRVLEKIPYVQCMAWMFTFVLEKRND